MGLSAVPVKGRQFQNLWVFNIANTMIGIFLKECFQHSARLLAVFGEDVALFDIVDTLAASERLLVKGDVGNKVEHIELAAVR